MALRHWPMRLATSRRVVTLLAALGARSGVRQGPGAAEVALTFDDGPHPVWTPRVLDALDAAGARATFFVVGRFAAEHPAIVRDAHRRGHEIGTHLYTHDRRTVDDDAGFDAELLRSRVELEQLLGAPVRWMRFPYGRPGHQRRAAVERTHRIRVAHWTVSSHDSKEHDPRAIVARAAAGLRPGAILLFHDRMADEATLRPPYRKDREVSLAAVKELLGIMAKRDLAAVTMSELFG